MALKIVWPGIVIFQTQMDPFSHPLNARTGYDPQDKSWVYHLGS